MCGFSQRTLSPVSNMSLAKLNFYSGIPHSIQALDTGAEFMLVFDDGDFSEDNTFLASEIFAHTPVYVTRILD